MLDDAKADDAAEDKGLALKEDRECYTDRASSDQKAVDGAEKTEVPAIDELGVQIRTFRKKPSEAEESSEDGYDSAVEQPLGEDKVSDVNRVSEFSQDDRTSREITEPESITKDEIGESCGGVENTALKQETAQTSAAPSQPLRAAQLDDPAPVTQGPSSSDHDHSDATAHVKGHSKERSVSEKLVLPEHLGAALPVGGASEWSHQKVVPQADSNEKATEDEHQWQNMPAYAPYDIYDDDGKLIAREAQESDDEAAAYAGLGGAGKGYTKVNVDEDAQSASSMDENTKYLFQEASTKAADEAEEEDARDPLAQLQATKDLLTEQQRIAYVAVVRVAMVLMVQELEKVEGTKATKKDLQLASEALKMWGQKMMVRLYAHMEVSSDEQVMIEQLAEHGVEPGDLTPTLMQNVRIKNPMAGDTQLDSETATTPARSSTDSSSKERTHLPAAPLEPTANSSSPPPYEIHDVDGFQQVQSPSQLPTTQSLDIDLRWTVLCDLFLLLLADSVYDSRSRVLLERVGSFMNVSWLEICKFEKRVTDALEMQESAEKENWNEDEHMETRRKLGVNRRIIMMGLATVGGSLVIGLSAGLLAPVIGAGLAAGFTTIGVAGTSGFLAGVGGAAVITTTGVLTGGAIAVKSAARRTGSVKTFEYRPLHNNKRVNLIVTVSGWMNGKVDDVRLPYSTVDPVMGDIYSVLWEPEMLQSMGQTINILATEALTQGLQQVLGSTVLVALMASLQLPIVLTKLSYLIDNPWTVSLDRAYSAGLILADSLIDRNLGVRPVTLVGFSLGSRVIFSCLKELANKGAFGLVQNVYLFGSPVVAKKDDYLRIRSVVSGRVVNGYAKNDWILGYLFRATSGGIMRVAGLAPVEGVAGLENVDVTNLVAGHMAYRAAMPRLLREVGWSVEGADFAEIEDPDPDNHQVRQREIIAEIDEARKELEKEPKKRRFGFFMRNKKLAEKKEWETYDESQREVHSNGSGNHVDEPESNVLFDIEAIRAELASEQIQVKEIESTLPPMKLNISLANGCEERGSDTPSSNLRMTKSFDGELTRTRADATLSSPSLAYHGSASPGRLRRAETGRNGSPGAEEMPRSSEGTAERTIYTPQPSPHVKAVVRPSLTPSMSMPMGVQSLEHNAWLDDEAEFGKEQEITLSFE